ncbi:hypothetical protein [Sphingobacterium multivorum]|uniref:hypothetical protein n=1 Tax=Sphingobacterium multivorum TaxID=28454 RepID=UPI00211565AF|nr:hypothetical protein [Sphingobacterium multivorum]
MLYVVVLLTVVPRHASAARGASDPVWKQLDPQIPKSNWWFPEPHSWHETSQTPQPT